MSPLLIAHKNTDLFAQIFTTYEFFSLLPVSIKKWEWETIYIWVKTILNPRNKTLKDTEKSSCKQKKWYLAIHFPIRILNLIFKK